MIDDQDLAEFSHTIFTGLTVGIGSLVLLFASDAQILLQCVFECHEGGVIRMGHGEEVNSSLILFGFLNHQIASAKMGPNMVLTLNFDDGRFVRIMPEPNGLESYVITTRRGICPIAVS
ncbi:hypothetical protein [Burkholderia sp. NLJ2]|uniref:hypothetical protein n=1 Tax=Burkholderia sp. NLJ2 TaxID=3090699 RepID=UPI003C6BE5E9